MVKKIDQDIHLVVRNNAYLLEESLLDFKKIIPITDVKKLEVTVRELGSLKESIESIEEAAIRKNS